MEVDDVSTESLIEQAKRAPYAALKGGKMFFARKNRTAKQLKCDEIALATVAADALRRSQPELKSLLKDPLWEGKPPKHKPEDLALLAVRYLNDSSIAKGNLYEQCRTYGQVVAYYLGLQISFDEISTHLMELGGIYPLLDRVRAEKLDNDDDQPRRRKSGEAKDVIKGKGKISVSTDSVKRGDVKKFCADDDDDSDERRHSEDLSPAAKRSRFDPTTDVVLEAPEHLDRILRFAHRTKLHITATVLIEDPDWHRIVIDDVRAELRDVLN